MPFNTRNPIPSGDLRDLDDNARNIDTWANDKTKLSHPDRFGVERYTWHGIEQKAQLDLADAVAEATSVSEQARDQAIDAKNAAQEAAMMSGFSKYADTLAQLEAGIGTDYVEGDVVMVFQDESRGDTSSIFKIESGVAEFKLTFDKTRQDLLSFTGNISADAEWSDVPAHSDPAFDVQARALANRVEWLKGASTTPEIEDTQTSLKFSEWVFGLPDIRQARKEGDTDAQMFQRAATLGGRWQVPAGVYDLNGVKVRTKLTLQCGPGVVFRRPAGSDIRQSSFNDGVACFEIDRCGASLTITGGFEYDGQESLQIAEEPTGWFVRAWAAEAGTELIELRLENPVFRNGTSGYVLARGDDAQCRWETRVDLINPLFYDTRLGYGKGDPATINPLGWLPDYVQILDYVRFTSLNFYAEWLGDIPLNRYAAAALRASFAGTDYTQSGEAIIAMYGDTRIKRMGRSGKKFDDPNDYLTNNGIGAIDCYGNVESIFVENLIADDCENVPLRAKASIKNFTCLNAVLNNCHRGIQVGPSTTGPCEAVVNIGSVTSYSGTVPQVEITGTSTTDRIPSATIGALNFYGTFTNPENLVAGSNGNLHIRNVSRLTAIAPKVYSSPVVGIRVQDVVSAEFYGVVARSSTQAAIVSLGIEKLSLNEPDLTSLAGAAFSIQQSSTASKIDVYGGKTRGSVDNGVLNLATNADITIDGLQVNSVSGTSRGFSNAVGSTMRLTKCSTNEVTTPVVVNGSLVLELGNSWNPNIRYGASYLTTVGTNKVGDIVYNTAPAPGGTIGWVCTAAGSPGTWKTFGAIAA